MSVPIAARQRTAAFFALLALAAPPFVALPSASLLAQDAAGPTANPDTARYVTPPVEIRRILATDKNYAALEYMSPDNDHFLVAHVNELSTLELMSRETYRLAEMELRPRTDRLWHLDTYGIDDFRFYSLARRRFVEVDLPEGSFASDFTWSPDGAHLAFLAHLPDHTEVWTAEAATGRARSVSDARVLATAGTGAQGQDTRPSRMLQWTPEGTLLTLLVPADRGAEPARDRIPDGPVARRTRAEPTRTPTYPNLLEDPHDEDLFEFYTKSQLAELAPGRPPVPIGEPRMYESISLSPNGTHILAEHMDRPFSYITSYRGFPRKTIVMDREGNLLSTVASSPLEEGRSRDDDDGDDPRAFAWRPDGSGLAFLRRAARQGDALREGGAAPEGDAPRPDRVMLATVPFDVEAATVVAESPDPIRSVAYSLDGRHAFASVTRDGDAGIVHFALGAGAAQPALLVPFHDPDDPLERQAELLTARTANGIDYTVVSTDGAAAYLQGPGYAEDFRPRPFVDRVAIADASKTRVFEGAASSWDRPLVPLDADLSRMIVSRESVTDFPDSWLWTRDDGFGDNLTNNVDPFPEITAARRIDFEFVRRDGLEVQGRVSMPVGWKDGDAPVPAIFWTYPREYETPEEYEHAAIESRNRNAFTHMSWLRWSDMWLTQGYALVYPDVPIVGESYNDTYIANLVDAMYGAIRAVDQLGVVDVDRIGHGGHSYGAFATANILANAPFFKAGIAGDGNYNRSLTPAGFQSERRLLWEAQDLYIEMSPFFQADRLSGALLMYHGMDDHNVGTHPIHADRMFH
ncbi:MAG TPA: prolyl oligopeptidase family serine peptidase, partial [Longimicrobiales bacterium]|nr:prolyl oligopeptidase family serine peptidase [Longimicrobiales bacterium]